MNPLDDLDLAECTVDGITFKTGKPVTFRYARHSSGASRQFNFGTRFGQDIEPAGRYMNFAAKGDNLEIPGLETGRQHFDNPLVLYWDGYGSDGWKARLSRHFRGKKHKALSTAIKRAGYDGIVTVARDYNHPSEIVVLL